MVLFIPNVRTLKERHDEPLRLHEDCLRCANLCFHFGFFWMRNDVMNGSQTNRQTTRPFEVVP